MDKEFDPFKGALALQGIDLNLIATVEHVLEIDWCNCTIKEQELVNFSVMGLNVFPPKNGVLLTLSPKAIITGTVLNLKHHCRLPFGAYAQTHEEGSNSVTTECTLGAICFSPVGNIQGSYKFMSLQTGKLIARQNFDELPATRNIIQRVGELAAQQKSLPEL
eukprot:2866673-Ditylum_brightwellii.AAC.1